ncbi:hypothetical protein [Demequina zhanjiangensis]|uniref:Novel STAND NTPase 5 domain-containing protein n=1 Tax=Demequina zhanjiangensis TaxID=3051659 RepID=A0ABT8G2W6_9MICO|nr:hypothetical protein [Demequina sp. SYSU T00b26]MDN4473465.1 hypothetical protein [Demequina sp. SYSU T00b26]
MPQLSPDLRDLAAHLAAGPAFLILGGDGATTLEKEARSYAWNGVYTSATDRAVEDAFRTDSRATSSLGAMGRAPSRSKTDLEVRYLFGGHHLPESERPPQTPAEEATARLLSNQELARLATETVTPRGTVLVEGWKPGGVLDPIDLVPALASLGSGQAHLFSAEPWADHALVRSFADSGQLVLHQESLSSAIRKIVEAGASRDAVDASTAASQHVIALDDGYADVDIHTWNQIRRSARPVDLALLTPPVFSSGAARYQEFRNFIGATEGVPRWRGIAAGMNLKRDYEADLLGKVRSELHDRDLPSPIVLAGQTATGKTTALAALAMELSRSGEAAVLHQSRRSVRPSVDDVEMYAAWAQEHGAKATVFVWDGMLEADEYEGFSRQLHARGRRVLVVGSSYRQKSHSSFVVGAPAALSDGETERMLALLASLGIEVRQPSRALDISFLAFLYRTLPDTERQLRTGLASEMRSAERGMARLARQRGEQATSDQRLTAMQAAFLEAGVSLEDLLPSTDEDETLADQSFANRAPIRRVTTLVLVAGRHGIPVPIDLALRILGREGFQSVRDALSSSDIVREIEEDDGDYYLATRSHLEAELLAQHEIPLDVEIDVVIEVIQNVRVSEGFTGGPDEVEFLVKLLERVGPNSERKARYEKYFGDVSDAIRQRRMDLGRIHPRLALQESDFARHYVQWQQRAGQGSLEERVASLEYNRELLDEVLADQSTRGLLRLSLSVELASTLGAIIHEFSEEGASESTLSMAARLDDVLKAVLDARAVDAGNTYPVDVLAWATRDAVQAGVLTPEERVDRMASAIAAIESLDRSSLSTNQLAEIDRRAHMLNKLLGNDSAAWEYLQSLERNTDPAAAYFLAQFAASEGPAGEAEALGFLRTAPPSTRRDWRCAQLLIDLTWKDITGSRLLSGERMPLYLSPQAIGRVTQMGADLDGADLPDAYRLQFIRAIAAFVSEEFGESRRLFNQVQDNTRQLARRLHTVYLIAGESGQPTVFTGRVETADSRYGQLWVNELATRVRFEPRLFNASGTFARNQQLGGFHVGFKLASGPVAEPRKMYRDAHRA